MSSACDPTPSTLIVSILNETSAFIWSYYSSCPASLLHLLFGDLDFHLPPCPRTLSFFPWQPNTRLSSCLCQETSSSQRFVLCGISLAHALLLVFFKRQSWLYSEQSIEIQGVFMSKMLYLGAGGRTFGPSSQKFVGWTSTQDIIFFNHQRKVSPIQQPHTPTYPGIIPIHPYICHFGHLSPLLY